MERINLVDLGFNSLGMDEKRYFFITMDMVMKNLHNHNQMITSFMPQDIYYDPDTKLIYYNKVSSIDDRSADSKEDAIRDNIIGLSTLAFCSYLKTYDPKDGLLNNGVIATEFNKFGEIFNEDDKDYYRKVLVDCYNTKTMPVPLYYSETILEKAQQRNSADKSDNKILSFATEAGRLMTDKNQEAAFGTQFFLVSMVACTVLVSIGYIIYLLSIFS